MLHIFHIRAKKVNPTPCLCCASGLARTSRCPHTHTHTHRGTVVPARPSLQSLQGGSNESRVQPAVRYSCGSSQYRWKNKEKTVGLAFYQVHFPPESLLLTQVNHNCCGRLLRRVEHITTARGQHRQRLKCIRVFFTFILWLNLTQNNSNMTDKTQAHLNPQTQSAQRTPQVHG